MALGRHTRWRRSARVLSVIALATALGCSGEGTNASLENSDGLTIYGVAADPGTILQTTRFPDGVAVFGGLWLRNDGNRPIRLTGFAFDSVDAGVTVVGIGLVDVDPIAAGCAVAYPPPDMKVVDVPGFVLRPGARVAPMIALQQEEPREAFVRGLVVNYEVDGRPLRLHQAYQIGFVPADDPRQGSYCGSRER